ncbi:MAG TPA: hypothetical protein VMR33_08065 [Candidatus Baltobacteraceae bacterium]|jgi:hypothetical protein|nr:hypothetical protein [Candidatus Baltobacteraceae bacterium]
MPKTKAKKGKKLTASAIAKVKESRVGGKRSSKADVEGQGNYWVTCYNDGCENLVPSTWPTFICYCDGVLNGNPYYGYP